MAFSIPNIYTHRNLKFLIAIPVILMLLGIYFSRGIILDSTLSGGSSITLQANTTLSAQQIAYQLSSRYGIPAPSVQVSSGQVLITVPANKSISNAEGYLLLLYQYHANYTQDVLNATNYRFALSRNPSNQTLQNMYALALQGENSSFSQINKYLGLETQALAPFVANPPENTSSADSMLATAQSLYNNATAKYQKGLISSISNVVPFKSYSYQDITVLQSSYFLQQLQTIIITAFVLISIIVFIIFRSAVPSFAVVFGAANDMIVALGAMALFKIPLGTASIGGLLMLLGYSIDTDVLTAIRILKRHEGTPESRAYGSMRTGLTMTFTAIVSFAVLFAISYIEYVPTYYEIAGVVLFGLIADLATTWLGNASIILMYVNKKNKGS
jgi:preprotein translocase subunit SecF